MKVKTMLRELKKFDENAELRLHCLKGECASSFTSAGNDVVVLEGDNHQKALSTQQAIKELERFNPDDEVKMHEPDGNNVLFVIGYVGHDDTVIVEDKSNNDLRSELCARYEKAEEENEDEKGFYEELFNLGFTMDDIWENVPERYDHAREFCAEHDIY